MSSPRNRDRGGSRDRDRDRGSARQELCLHALAAPTAGEADAARVRSPPPGSRAACCHVFVGPPHDQTVAGGGAEATATAAGGTAAAAVSGGGMAGTETATAARARGTAARTPASLAGANERPRNPKYWHTLPWPAPPRGRHAATSAVVSPRVRAWVKGWGLCPASQPSSRAACLFTLPAMHAVVRALARSTTRLSSGATTT